MKQIIPSKSFHKSIKYKCERIIEELNLIKTLLTINIDIFNNKLDDDRMVKYIDVLLRNIEHKVTNNSILLSFLIQTLKNYLNIYIYILCILI